MKWQRRSKGLSFGRKCHVCHQIFYCSHGKGAEFNCAVMTKPFSCTCPACCGTSSEDCLHHCFHIRKGSKEYSMLKLLSKIEGPR